MKNNYLLRCALLAVLFTVGMIGTVAPVYATGSTFSPLPLPAPEENITVTGRVVDDAGEPLIGVSILVKGSSKGTATDVMVIIHCQCRPVLYSRLLISE